MSLQEQECIEILMLILIEILKMNVL